MQRSILIILRQRTGASPETYQLWLMLLVATASLFLILTTFSYANNKSRVRIHGGGSPNSPWDKETRGESKLLQRIILAKFGF